MTAAAENTAQRIWDNAVVFVLRMGKMGNTGKVPEGSVQTPESNPEWVRIRAQLIDSEEWRTIKNLQTEVRRYVESYSLPCQLELRGGAFLVPVASVETIATRVDQYIEQFWGLVQEFVAAYPAALEAAEEQLGPLFDASNYPGQQAVQAKFKMEYSIRTIGVPKTLRGVLLKKEMEKARAAAEEMAEGMRLGLRERMQGLVHHLREVLSNGKVMKKAAADNLDEFIQIFAAQNEVADDAALADLVEQARKLLHGVDLPTLRKAPDAKVALDAAFGEIEKKLDTMITDKPLRVIDFEDE